jgi:gliding motility-associated-like protein
MKFTLSIVFTFLVQFSLLAQYIQVNDNYSAQELVEDILINSPCANVSNFSASGWDEFRSYGYFSRGTSNFPFEEGVLITTGRAVSAIGPNTTLLSEGPTSWGGDQDLENAIGEFNTVNATILEFDFLPVANKITFEYIFSSEQYYAYSNPNQCNFSDGFAFLLREANGPIEFQNLAVVPNTNIPVKITTIRGEGTICPAANPQYFDAFNGTEHPTNYNGQTKILKAEANVTPGVLYRMKLVIADQGNPFYDSAIFLGGGSFSVETDLGEDRLIATGNPICEGDSLLLDASQDGDNNTYQWYRNDIIIPGETNAVFEVTQPGVYRVEIELGNSGCTTSGEITIEYTVPIPGLNATLFQCVESLSDPAVFNLFNAQPQIALGNPNLQVISFHTTLEGAENNTNIIFNATTYTSNIDGEIVFARVSDALGCTSIAEVTLRHTENFLDEVDLVACSLPNNSGFANFDFTSVSNQLFTAYGNNIQVSYHNSLQHALLGIQELPINYTNTQSNFQTVYGRISNTQGCFGIVPIHLIVIAAPQLGDNTSILLCLNEGSDSVTLSSGVQGNVSNFEFLWSTGETTPTISVSASGIYSVSVTGSQTFQGETYTCTSTREIELTVSEIAQADYELSQNHGQQNITIITAGTGDYVFSLNNENGPYQENPVFENVPVGVHTVFIKDLNGCGVTSLQIYILGFPNFFTPNNDGYHDFWQIKGWESGDVRLKEVVIFDRFGKIIHYLDLNSNGWDGTYKGNPLPSSDYWFKATFSDGGVFQSHFTLKR